MNSNERFSLPKLPDVDGIEWSGGSSLQRFISNVNGKQASSFIVSVSFSFTVNRAGSITIPSFTVKTGSGRQKTKPVTITVRKSVEVKDVRDAVDQQAFGMLRLQEAADGTKRTKYYIGEDIPLLFFIYVRSQYSPEATGTITLIPDPRGSASLTAPPQQQGAKRQVIDGKEFNQITFSLSARAMMPGTLELRTTLPLMLFTDDGFFSSAFRSPAGRKTVTGTLSGLEIMPLPEPPQGAVFSGLIGHDWQIRSTLSEGPYRVGEPLTLQLTVSGEGDVDRLEFTPPKMDSFRAYPPEIERSPKSKIARVTLTLLPLKEGEVMLKLPFTVFDTVKGQYEGISFERKITIEAGSKSVAAGTALSAGSGLPQTEQEKPVRNQQILYLHDNTDGPVPVYFPGEAWTGKEMSLWKNAVFPSVGLITFGLIVYVISFLLMLRKKRLSADPAIRRRNAARAGRSALLKKLKDMPEDGMPAGLSDELCEYLTAVLDLPPGTSLSEIADGLQANDPEFAAMLKKLSVSAWAPKGAGSKFDAPFRDRLIRAVGKLSAVLLIFAASGLSAADFADVRKAYDSGDFKKALQLCEENLQQDPVRASDLYNSGNCRFQLGDLPGALADFERAAKLSPRDTDIRENLNLTRRKLGLPEKYSLDSPTDLPVVLRDLLRIDEWIIAAAAGLMLCLFGTGLSMIWGRKIMIILCTAGAVLILLAGSAAFWQYISASSGEAIILNADTPVYSLPSEISGRVEAKLGAGREVRISAYRMDWFRIRYNGGEGWIKAGAAKTIWPE